MEQTIKLIRGLVWAEIILTIICIVLSFADYKLLPEPHRTIVQDHLKADLTPFETGISLLAVAFLVLLIIAWVRLLKLSPSAPKLYLSAQTAGILLGIFLGPVVTSGLLSSLTHISSMLGGAILFMVWVSPARLLFTENPASPSPSTSN